MSARDSPTACAARMNLRRSAEHISLVAPVAARLCGSAPAADRPARSSAGGRRHTASFCQLTNAHDRQDKSLTFDLGSKVYHPRVSRHDLAVIGSRAAAFSAAIAARRRNKSVIMVEPGNLRPVPAVGREDSETEPVGGYPFASDAPQCRVTVDQEAKSDSAGRSRSGRSASRASCQLSRDRLAADAKPSHVCRFPAQHQPTLGAWRL